MKDISEATAPTKIHHKLTESDVQKKCVAWARARGYWARKFSSMSQRSVPDYLFAQPLLQGLWAYDMTRAGLKFACEFKAPGKTSTEAQIEEQIAMRDAGWFVFECDGFDRFVSMVAEYERAC